MLKRISEFFKPKKSEPQTTLIMLKALPEWLDTEEKECMEKRSEHINRSRSVISGARDDIIRLLGDFGTEDNELALHPKVEQVNKHNLPQFIRKIESTLDVTFSDDDEAYYRQVADMIDGCFKAYRGPGRYLHHIYADEVKLFRQYMDIIGKELNHLTEVIKRSRIRLQSIGTVRSAIEKYNHGSDESRLILSLQDEIQEKRVDRTDQLARITADREDAAKGKEYAEYSNLLSESTEREKRKDALFETLDAHIRTALPIWRKMLRIAVDERDREGEKRLDHLINLAISQDYADSGFLSGLKETAPLIFQNIGDDKVSLKNSFEKSLFFSADSYLGQISEATASWSESVRIFREEHDLLASHPAAREIAVLDQKIGEIQREIHHLEEEDQKIQGRMHHNERELGEAAKIIRDAMHELTEGSVTVTGLGEENQEHE